MAMDGDGGTLVRFGSGSNGESCSFVGELEGSAAMLTGVPGLAGIGDSRVVPSAAEGRIPTRWAAGGGVLAGDDFCGEMDLARSVRTNTRQIIVSMENRSQKPSNPSAERGRESIDRGERKDAQAHNKQRREET
jgi:hypothetical protein